MSTPMLIMNDTSLLMCPGLLPLRMGLRSHGKEEAAIATGIEEPC